MSDIRTLVELFDECQIENMAACALYKPEKVVFIGFKNTMTKSRMAAIDAFLRLRGIDAAIDYRIVPRYDFESIVTALLETTYSEDDCCFDLTGGKELILTAIGYAAAVRKVPMIQIDIKKGGVIYVANCASLPEPGPVQLSVPEVIALNGGAVVHGVEGETEWDMSADFLHDIGLMWDICRDNCGAWNRQCCTLAALEKICGISQGLTVRGDTGRARGMKQDIYINGDIISRLTDAGLLTDHSIDADRFIFTYKNEQVHRCIKKAGNILELYTYSVIREINAEAQEAHYDADIGVYVDWDTEYGWKDTKLDTINEIDVLAVDGMIPVFISCKNGEVKKEALYELDTVSERFGGEYSKKILLATYMTPDEESKQFLLKRAEDMGIEVIHGVERMTRAEFKNILKNSI